MFEYDFMRTAFVAGGLAAIVSGSVGFFLVLRNLTFAGHALSHVGFAGATGSVLIGASPMWGLLAFTLVAGIAMGLLGDRMRGRDVAVGIVLSLALGLGVLFLYLYSTHATRATAILFGNVLGVSGEMVWALLVLSAASVCALAAMSRPLLFATLAPEMAEAKGVSPRLVSVLFLAVVAVAVAEAAQVVGVLLVFALMVGPAATSLRLTSRVELGHRTCGHFCTRRDLARDRPRLHHRLAHDILDRGAELLRVFPELARSARALAVAAGSALSPFPAIDARARARRIHVHNSRMKSRGADTLIRTLASAGVRRIFTVSGNHIMPVFDAALDGGIELIHARHEAAAVHMADASTRISGEVGVALVTGGPGHANASFCVVHGADGRVSGVADFRTRSHSRAWDGSVSGDAPGRHRRMGNQGGMDVRRPRRGGRQYRARDTRRAIGSAGTRAHRASPSKRSRAMQVRPARRRQRISARCRSHSTCRLAMRCCGDCATRRARSSSSGRPA